MDFDFEKFSFMIDPYNDWTPQQGTNKASQCGWSVMTNLKLFYAARYGIPKYGLSAANVIYTLPSDSDVNVFVPSKTNLLIKINPIIRSYLRDESGNAGNVDSIQRKKIGNSMVYFKGTRSKTAAIMLSADLLIHDESDRSEKSIIDEYESRTAQSIYKGRWVFSNPDAPNLPADLMYLDSDQKHWFIKCEHCGAWQYLDWYKLSEYDIHYDARNPHCFIDDTNGLYVCGKCGRPISDDNRKRGRWVKKFKDRSISGYWVSHFMYSWIPCMELVKVEKKKPKKYFLNFVAGKPYVGSDVRVDSKTIVANIVLDAHQWHRGEVAMGVDNGDTKHVVIGDRDGIFQAFKTQSWDDVEDMIKKYEPTCVIDLNPYPNKPRELARKYRPINGMKSRVYCNYYVENTKDYELIEWGTGEKWHMVYPDRNRLFDHLVEFIANGNIKYFQAKSYWEEYIEQWETMYRADMIGTRQLDNVPVSPNQIVRGIWLSTNRNDHYCHATLMYYVALQKIIGGAGVVMQSQTPTQKVASAIGGIETSPAAGEEEHTVKQSHSFIPDLSKLGNKKNSGSASGNM